MLNKADLIEWHKSRAEYFVEMMKTHEGFAASENAIRYHLNHRYLERAKEYEKEARFHYEAVAFLEGL